MTVCAVTMVRDEDDIIASTLVHLLSEGVDHIIVADNLSTDDTRTILDSCPIARVTVVDDTEPGYYQADKMSRLARMAYDAGASWVLPFDADEVWYWPHSTLAQFFAQCRDDVIEAHGWDHICTDLDGGNIRSISMRRPEQQPLPKVAFRAHPLARLHMGNHDVDRPGKRGGGLEYRHFQYRSYEQMRAKLRTGAQAYAASDLHPMYGTHWREGGALSDVELERKWADLCATDGLVHDPAPVKP